MRVDLRYAVYTNVNLLVLRGLIARNEGKAPKQERMKVVNGIVFLFHVIRNFRESASLSKHFVLTVYIVYPSAAILIFLISFSFFYYTLLHHFKNSFQETSLQSSKLHCICRDFGEEVAWRG